MEKAKLKRIGFLLLDVFMFLLTIACIIICVEQIYNIAVHDKYDKGMAILAFIHLTLTFVSDMVRKISGWRKKKLESAMKKNEEEKEEI